MIGVVSLIMLINLAITIYFSLYSIRSVLFKLFNRFKDKLFKLYKFIGCPWIRLKPHKQYELKFGLEEYV